jgi:hypothetical protein
MCETAGLRAGGSACGARLARNRGRVAVSLVRDRLKGLADLRLGQLVMARARSAQRLAGIPHHILDFLPVTNPPL